MAQLTFSLEMRMQLSRVKTSISGAAPHSIDFANCQSEPEELADSTTQALMRTH
jgi:hypothetical protein